MLLSMPLVLVLMDVLLAIMFLVSLLIMSLLPVVGLDFWLLVDLQTI